MEPIELDAVTHAYAEDCLGWKCTICQLSAKDQLGLQDEWLGCDTTVYTYRFDGSKWVACDECNNKYHLKCVTHQTEEAVIANGRFFCTFLECKSQK